jgi:hypothetical protein
LAGLAMSGGLCLCDTEFDLSKPCLICRSDEEFARKVIKKVIKKDLEILKKAPKISDRRLAVLATKRKNKNVQE